MTWCTGEVVSDVECQRRMQAAKQTGEPHFYMMELGPGLIIDARDKGNIARLINSSCAPNCQSQKWHDAATGMLQHADSLLLYIATFCAGSASQRLTTLPDVSPAP